MRVSSQRSGVQCAVQCSANAMLGWASAVRMRCGCGADAVRYGAVRSV